MKKIAKVITECKDCPHFVLASSSDSMGKEDVAICDYELADDDGDIIKDTSFLLSYTPQNNVNDYQIEIPDSCPLETYNEK